MDSLPHYQGTLVAISSGCFAALTVAGHIRGLYVQKEMDRHRFCIQSIIFPMYDLIIVVLACSSSWTRMFLSGACGFWGSTEASSELNLHFIIYIIKGPVSKYICSCTCMWKIHMLLHTFFFLQFIFVLSIYMLTFSSWGNYF